MKGVGCFPKGLPGKRFLGVSYLAMTSLAELARHAFLSASVFSIVRFGSSLRRWTIQTLFLHRAQHAGFRKVLRFYGPMLVQGK